MSDDCLFCKIVAREIPADIVHEDDDTLAFRDINPQAPVHVLVIPRLHTPTVSAAAGLEGGADLLGKMMVTATKVARELGLWPGDGYRTLINTGEQAAQTVFHVHVHVLGGRSFGWPPG
jgi:histidine triad (HIT) family protein